MTTREKVKKIISKVFKLEYVIIQDELSLDNHENWDSMGQLILLSALEQEFNLNIDFEDSLELTNVKSIINFFEMKNDEK
jgi:acyl carrier protein